MGRPFVERLNGTYLERRKEESPWQHRKRVFPEYFEIDFAGAILFFLGYEGSEIGPWERYLALTVVSALQAGDQLNRQKLISFVEQFDEDPISSVPQRP